MAIPSILVEGSSPSERQAQAPTAARTPRSQQPPRVTKEDQPTQTDASIFDELIPKHQAAAIGVPKTYIAQLRANLQLLRLRLFLLLDFTVPSVEACQVLTQVEADNELCEHEEEMLQVAFSAGIPGATDPKEVRLYRTDVDLHFRALYEELQLLWKARRQELLNARDARSHQQILGDAALLTKQAREERDLLQKRVKQLEFSLELEKSHKEGQTATYQEGLKAYYAELLSLKEQLYRSYKDKNFAEVPINLLRPDEAIGRLPRAAAGGVPETSRKTFMLGGNQQDQVDQLRKEKQKDEMILRLVKDREAEREKVRDVERLLTAQRAQHQETIAKANKIEDENCTLHAMVEAAQQRLQALEEENTQMLRAMKAKGIRRVDDGKVSATDKAALWQLLQENPESIELTSTVGVQVDLLPTPGETRSVATFTDGLSHAVINLQVPGLPPINPAPTSAPSTGHQGSGSSGADGVAGDKATSFRRQRGELGREATRNPTGRDNGSGSNSPLQEAQAESFRRSPEGRNRAQVEPLSSSFGSFNGSRRLSAVSDSIAPVSPSTRGTPEKKPPKSKESSEPRQPRREDMAKIEALERKVELTERTLVDMRNQRDALTAKLQTKEREEVAYRKLKAAEEAAAASKKILPADVDIAIHEDDTEEMQALKQRVVLAEEKARQEARSKKDLLTAKGLTEWKRKMEEEIKDQHIKNLKKEAEKAKKERREAGGKPLGASPLVAMQTRMMLEDFRGEAAILQDRVHQWRKAYIEKLEAYEHVSEEYHVLRSEYADILRQYTVFHEQGLLKLLKLKDTEVDIEAVWKRLTEVETSATGSTTLKHVKNLLAYLKAGVPGEEQANPDPIAPSPSPAPAAAHALAPPPPSDLDFLRPARAGLAGLAAKPPLFGGVPQLPPTEPQESTVLQSASELNEDLKGDPNPVISQAAHATTALLVFRSLMQRQVDRVMALESVQVTLDRMHHGDDKKLAERPRRLLGMSEQKWAMFRDIERWARHIAAFLQKNREVVGVEQRATTAKSKGGRLQTPEEPRRSSVNRSLTPRLADLEDFLYQTVGAKEEYLQQEQIEDAAEAAAARRAAPSPSAAAQPQPRGKAVAGTAPTRLLKKNPLTNTVEYAASVLDIGLPVSPTTGSSRPGMKQAAVMLDAGALAPIVLSPSDIELVPLSPDSGANMPRLDGFRTRSPPSRAVRSTSIYEHRNVTPPRAHPGATVYRHLTDVDDDFAADRYEAASPTQAGPEGDVRIAAVGSQLPVVPKAKSSPTPMFGTRKSQRQRPTIVTGAVQGVGMVGEKLPRL